MQPGRGAMRPLSDWPMQVRRAIVGVFTDIDDTLTTDGAITDGAGDSTGCPNPRRAGAAGRRGGSENGTSNDAVVASGDVSVGVAAGSGRSMIATARSDRPPTEAATKDFILGTPGSGGNGQDMAT